MSTRATLPDNESMAAAAFTRQSGKFDAMYSDDRIIGYKRNRVRAHLSGKVFPGCHILELNSGTGEDAIWLAQQGCHVHATDLSTGMLERLQQKVRTAGLQSAVTVECCSFTALSALQQKGPFDLIFSNFAGLNCTGELDRVLSSFSSLLKPGGIVTLVILPPFCLWEFLLIFKGKFKTATRRLFSRKGARAHLEGRYFTCWYYKPSYVIRHLQKDFSVLSVEGLCTMVPPSYIEKFAENHPRAFQILKTGEDRWKGKWPWKYLGDYYIISLQKKSGAHTEAGSPASNRLTRDS